MDFRLPGLLGMQCQSLTPSTTNCLDKFRILPRRMCIVHLLLHLLARDMQIRTPRRNHIISTVRTRVEDRLMLSH